jgi:hypothetical protein
MEEGVERIGKALFPAGCWHIAGDAVDAAASGAPAWLLGAEEFGEVWGCVRDRQCPWVEQPGACTLQIAQI